MDKAPFIRNGQNYRHILDNLRRTDPRLEKFSDEQVYEAWDNWSTSNDHPDELKIIEWVC